VNEWSTRRRDLYTWLHKQHSQEANIHARDRIQTRNPRRRAAADPGLRPRGQKRSLQFT